MKKKIFLFIFVIITVSLCLAFGIYKINSTEKPMNEVKKDNVKPLAGTKLKENIYTFSLDTEGIYYPDIYIEDDEIFYLEEKNNLFKLTSQNIYTGELKSIEKKIKNTSCNFENGNIKCFKNDKIFFLDNNLEPIKNFESKNDIYAYVPYQDTFINALEVSKINQDKVIYSNYIHNKENTYIIYNHTLFNMLIIYDVKNDLIYEEYFEKYTINKDGILIINDKNVVQIFLNDSKINKIEYDSTIKDGLYYDYSTSSDLKMMVNYAPIINKVFVENLSDKSLLEIDVKDLKLDYINQIFIEGNYVYLVTNIDELNKIFVIDITNQKFISTKKYYQKLNKEIEDKIKIIKDEYEINVLIKESTNVSFDSFNAQYTDNNFLILSYIDKILEIAKRFNKEFFHTYYKGNLAGLNIYLTGNLTPKYENQYSYPAAYTLNYKDKYTIVLDVYQKEIEENICHEISHSLENIISANIYSNDSIYDDWNKYNPINYKYNDSYTNALSEKYTIDGETNKKNVYFISSYGNTYPNEDRAQIFSYICSKNKKLLEYGNLKNKAEYMKDEILKFYPMLSNSTLFELIK